MNKIVIVSFFLLIVYFYSKSSQVESRSTTINTPMNVENIMEIDELKEEIAEQKKENKKLKKQSRNRNLFLFFLLSLLLGSLFYVFYYGKLANIPFIQMSEGETLGVVNKSKKGLDMQKQELRSQLEKSNKWNRYLRAVLEQTKDTPSNKQKQVLRRELTQSKKQKQNLERNLTQSKRQKQDLERNLNQSRVQNDNLKKSKSELQKLKQNEIQNLRKNLNQYNKQKQNLERNLTESNKQKQVLRGQLKKSNDQNKLKETLAGTQRSRLYTAAINREKTNENLRQELKQLKVQNENLKNLNAAKITQQKQKQNEIQNLRKRLNQSQIQKQKLRQNLQNFKGSNSSSGSFQSLFDSPSQSISDISNKSNSNNYVIDIDALTAPRFNNFMN